MAWILSGFSRTLIVQEESSERFPSLVSSQYFDFFTATSIVIESEVWRKHDPLFIKMSIIIYFHNKQQSAKTQPTLTQEKLQVDLKSKQVVGKSYNKYCSKNLC